MSQEPEVKAAIISSKSGIVIAIIGLVGGLLIAILGPYADKWANRSFPNDLQSKAVCPAYLESNGQVVINADQYMEQVPGRNYSSDGIDALRDATGISWQKNNEFPNTLQALPDLQPINTFDNTNGPALVYLIDFHTNGKFYVYIRGFGPNDGSDSIHIGLGGIPVTTDSNYGFSLLSDKPTPRWVKGSDNSGDQVFIEVQNPGLNTFYIWMRENGVNVQRIWLDTGPNKISNGDITEGPAISPCGK